MQPLYELETTYGVTEGAWVSNDEPAKTCRPSASFTVRAFAVDGSSFDRNPSTVMTLPGLSEFLFHPRRISVVGGPSSKSQSFFTPFSSGPLTTTRACGLVHSRRTTSPVTAIGLDESYSAANE